MKLILISIFTFIQAIALVSANVEVKSFSFVTVLLSTVVLMAISAVIEEDNEH